MKLSKKTFQVLDTLDSQEISTQRQLADHADVSLGQVNFILQSLLKKGLIKIGNFRKNPRKIGYVYLLTPKGIEAKSKMAVRFLMSKLSEYNILRKRLAERLSYIEGKGHARVIFIGPSIVKDFLISIIKERYLNIILTNHYSSWRDLKNIDQESFDIALLFNDKLEGINKIEKILNIPHKKLLPLW